MPMLMHGTPITQYQHWTGKPPTPGRHTLALVPQTMADGWEGYCSCGEWKAFADVIGRRREDAVAEINAKFVRHVNDVAVGEGEV